MHFIGNTSRKKGKLQVKKKGGEVLMFGNEFMIGSIRTQSENLKKMLVQLESDENWAKNSSYYAKEMSDIEKCLRMIRKKDLESINICGSCVVCNVK